MRDRGELPTYDPLAALNTALPPEQLRRVEEMVTEALSKLGDYEGIDAAAVQNVSASVASASSSFRRGSLGGAGQNVSASAGVGPLLLYVSPRNVDKNDLHKLLGKRLPSHLRPAHIVLLDAIPRLEARAGHSHRPVDAAELPLPSAADTADPSAARPSLLTRRWVNKPNSLPLVAMDPNSHELTHPKRDAPVHTAQSPDGEHAGGSCHWARTPRLSGATSYEVFDTWLQARQWMEGEWMDGKAPPLRTPHLAPNGQPRPLGACADSIEEEAPSAGGDDEGDDGDDGAASGKRGDALESDGRYTYDGVPTAILPPTRAWHMLDKPSGDAKAAEKWVVGYTRDRADFPNLKWRILEASSREKLQEKLDRYLSTSYDVGACEAVVATERHGSTAKASQRTFP